MKSKADMVFEASWEVCNKCGGIYTVVTSKVPLMQNYYDTYTLIGPLFDDLPVDFVQKRPPEPFARVFSNLSQLGIRCVYGEWDILGSPATVLIDARHLQKHLNDYKTKFFVDFGVESLFASNDFNEPLLWSVGVGMFLQGIEKQFSANKIVAHFHEWLSGFALLHLNSNHSKIATVFTTHATMLGRSLASKDKKAFNNLENIDVKKISKELGVVEKYSTERACAKAADVFTTVSDITAKEAKIIFGREPRVLPNGLPIDLFPTFEQTSIEHGEFKEKLKTFTIAHFFPYQTFDLEKTLFYYSSGRYEFENKGLDITIDALGKLNQNLKDEVSDQTIVMFFFMAMNSQGPKQELVESHVNLDELEDDIKEKEDYFSKKILLDIIMGDKSKVEIVPPHFIQSKRRKFHHLRRQGNPPIFTHNLYGDENQDPIITNCKRVGLLNREEDRVKVVFLPAYLYGYDGLLNLEYYEAVSGCHLGIFPSFYEPWGYTPLESISLGVPAITSNTSGFAQFVADKVEKKNPGLYIVDRTKDRFEEVNQLFDFLLNFALNNKSSRVACKINAHSLASFADWRELVRFYICAHNEALGMPCTVDDLKFEEDG